MTDTEKLECATAALAAMFNRDRIQEWFQRYEPDSVPKLLEATWVPLNNSGSTLMLVSRAYELLTGEKPPSGRGGMME